MDNWHGTSGVPSLDALMDEAIPPSIRLDAPLELPPGTSEHEYLEALREELGEHAAPVTRLCPRLLVARARAGATAQVRASLESVWAGLRPRLCGTTAQAPRLWAT